MTWMKVACRRQVWVKNMSKVKQRPASLLVYRLKWVFSRLWKIKYLNINSCIWKYKHQKYSFKRQAHLKFRKTRSARLYFSGCFPDRIWRQAYSDVRPTPPDVYRCMLSLLTSLVFCGEPKEWLQHIQSRASPQLRTPLPLRRSSLPCPGYAHGTRMSVCIFERSCISVVVGCLNCKTKAYS